MPYKTPFRKQDPPYKVRLCYDYCPGDSCVLTMVLETIHRNHPGLFITDVETAGPELFRWNPHVKPMLRYEPHRVRCHHHDIVNANVHQKHFAQVLCEQVSKGLDVPLSLAVDRPHFYWTDAEEDWSPSWSSPYCLIPVNTKGDYTTKYPGHDLFQKTTDALLKRGITVVQVGQPHYYHRTLTGAVDMVGKTTLRDLMVLARHAAFGIGGVTALYHIFAGCERPYVLLNSRETFAWLRYPKTVQLTAGGSLPCCQVNRGCWKDRVVALPDNASWNDKLCELPVLTECGETVPKCYDFPGRTDTPKIMEAVDRIMSGGRLGLTMF